MTLPEIWKIRLHNTTSELCVAYMACLLSIDYNGACLAQFQVWPINKISLRSEDLRVETKHRLFGLKQNIPKITVKAR